MTKQTSLLAPDKPVETVVYDMPEQEYRAAPGLSNSAIKDLEVSPLRFWYLHVNPNPPMQEPSPYLIFGEALHCAVLEPQAFETRYAQELQQSDHPGCLVTIEDIRGWIRDKGYTPKGTKKADVISQAQAIDGRVPIWDVLEKIHFATHNGKTMLSKDFWDRVNGCAGAVEAEPVVRGMLANGKPEVSMFATDPETGVLLKTRIDWLTPYGVIGDLKSFSQKRGNSIEKSVADAIYYEKYHRQAWLYRYVYGLQAEPLMLKHSKYINVFVESDPPHDVRLKELKSGNLYWEMARAEMQALIRLYAECRERFGDKPWRDDQRVEDLTDEDVKQFAY